MQHLRPDATKAKEGPQKLQRSAHVSTRLRMYDKQCGDRMPRYKTLAPANLGTNPSRQAQILRVTNTSLESRPKPGPKMLAKCLSKVSPGEPDAAQRRKHVSQG